MPPHQILETAGTGTRDLINRLFLQHTLWLTAWTSGKGKEKQKGPFQLNYFMLKHKEIEPESWELRVTGDRKGLTLGRSWDLSETTPKTRGMSCHEGRFDTCDTGGSCRSSWSLCTTSVKSSAWKQTTSLVIRGWSLLEKDENSKNF